MSEMGHPELHIKLVISRKAEIREIKIFTENFNTI